MDRGTRIKEISKEIKMWTKQKSGVYRIFDAGRARGT
jgi:hypothetical protein